MSELPKIPPKHLKNGCYARADAIEAHLEAAKAELTQLRGNLSLAEEGLANYAQEVEQLRAAMKCAERLFNTLCFDMPDWVGRNEGICGPFRVALNGEIRTRPAQPQSEPQSVK
jgi:hypothetical protein